MLTMTGVNFIQLLFFPRFFIRFRFSPLKGRFFGVFFFVCLLSSERGNGKEAGSRVAQDLADIR